MARFTAFYSVKFSPSTMDFNWYVRNYSDSGFYDNNYQPYAGITYEDAAFILGDDGRREAAAGIAGSGFVLDPVTSKFIAGTLQFVGEAAPSLDADIWTMDKFAIPVAIFDNAMTSKNTADDLDFWGLALSGNDSFKLSPYDDSMRGFGGNDRMFGNGGNDVLAGEEGDDYLDGGIGDDLLYGGLGKDTMRGDFGRDLFIFKDASEAGVGRARDKIKDFANLYDSLDLRSIDADTISAGNQRFTFIGEAKFEVGAKAQLRFDNGVLSGDVNRDGQADFEIGFTNGITLDPNSIIL